MSTDHLWFRSGNYFLLGHLNAPQQTRGRVGVVIVPPFGWEEVCSYRPLRFMAQRLAEMGIPTLRYDLPGTGDSSGDALDPGLFEAWVRSLDAAALQLRNATGVEDVAAVGIHLGAMLAVAAAARGANLQALVLWGPAATGRAILREWRAAANLERWESLPAEDAPPQSIPGFEVGGFLIAPETQRALEDLDCSAPTLPPSGRILLLSRDNLAHDAKLIGALRCSAAAFEVAVGHGYSAMMATPHEAVCPEDTTRLIAEFLSQDVYQEGVPDPIASHSDSTPLAEPSEVHESVYRIETAGLGMFGILTQPGPGVSRSEYCILYLNPGGVRHIGPNRMWVESARRWAAQGVVSLRLDLQSIGESEGEQVIDVPGLYREPLMEQVEIAIDALRSEVGITRFVTIGLCSGACWAFHSAVRNPLVRAAILLNPSLLYWDPSADRRRILRGIASGYAQWAEWSQLVRGRIQRGDIKRTARRVVARLGRKGEKQRGYLQLGFETVPQVWSFLESSRKRVTLVFRDGEPLFTELETARELPSDTNSFVRCVRIPNGGHTFRPLWAQRIVHDTIDLELANVIEAVSEDATAIQAGDRVESPKTVHA